MKKSSALQRCAVYGAANAGGTNGTTECETEVTFNKGRQAVVRMLGNKSWIIEFPKMMKNLHRGFVSIN